MYFEALASGGGSDWYYTILMKAPLGAKITVDDGDEEVEATGAGMDTIIGIPVHNDSSTYTVSVEMNGLTAPTSSITTPATSGGISTVVEVPFAKISLTYDDEFRGQSMSMTDGTHTASPSPVLPALGNTVDVYVPYTGNWTLEATDPVSGNPFNSSPNPVPVVSLDQTIPAGLYVIPDGKTVLPVNDIETWLLCADIKDVSYSTLAEVLADEDVLRRLLTDDNAIDYLKRSTEWIINPGLVPIMIDATHPSGEATASSQQTGYEAYKAFNGVDDGSIFWSASGAGQGSWLRYEFPSAVIVKSARIRSRLAGSQLTLKGYEIQASNDGFVNQTVVLYSGTAPNEDTPQYVSFDNDTAYKYYRLYATTNSYYTSGTINIVSLQFYPRVDKGITGNEIAMSYIGAYDYAADTLLSDSDWAEGICNSEYFENVLNAEVPVMTSNTEPSGEASGDSCFSSPTYAAYRAFNDNYGSTDFWVSDGTSAASGATDTHWLQYRFDNLVKVAKTYVDHSTHGWGSDNITSITVKGSNDNFVSEDVTLATITPDTSTHKDTIVFGNASQYRYYRLETVGYNGHAEAINNKYVVSIDKLQFYGRQAAGVQTLLKAAGVDRPYTTLDELLADKEALATVIGSHAAIDYLVTVKDWIDEFTSDETAMLFIGGDNYAANTLLGDDEWFEGILKSNYFREVYNISVPKMTNNTTPSGTASGVLIQGYTGEAYCAFDDDESTYVYFLPTTGYVQYEFPSAVVVDTIYLKSNAIVDANNCANVMHVRASNDPTFASYDSLYDVTVTKQAYPNGLEFNVKLNNTTAYKYYRLVTENSASGYGGNKWHTIKYCGREDVTEGVHIFSAASDTIYDQNNQVVATTDTSGHVLIDKANLPNGTYTLRSTVAKDPDNLSNDFTKVVEVTDATKAIFLMPDNTLYWYGYSDSDMEICSTANGWATGHSNYSLIDPTFNANSVVCDVPTYRVAGYGTKTAKDYDNATVHLIDKTADTDQIFMYSTVKNDMMHANVLVAEGGNVMKHQTTTINGAALYLAFYAGFQGAAVYKTMYALWIE